MFCVFDNVEYSGDMNYVHPTACIDSHKKSGVTQAFSRTDHRTMIEKETSFVKNTDNACFALLDDCLATNVQRTSRLYENFECEHRCTNPADLDVMWQKVNVDLENGLHAVLLIDYEWGAKLLQSGHQRLDRVDSASLKVLMFRTLKRLSAQEVTDWLIQHPENSTDPAGVMNLASSVKAEEFHQTIASIQEAIAAGETYQVNYTYRLQGEAFGSPLALYQALRQRQAVPFGALIALPARAQTSENSTTHVLSCSPELFLRHENGLLTARPMKGTTSKTQDCLQNEQAASRLSLDIKNRAENLMIVDLLRNDLSRVAQTGSVKVPALFAVESHGDVLQMTSTVQAQIKPDVDFAAVLRAAYPCGSITGAPKHHTMGLIANLETTARGLYCGAIGWLDAPQEGAQCPNFCLSVTIRTLTLGPCSSQGLRRAELGVGAGIVADSLAAAELEECQLKACFLTQLNPGFDLFETMLAETVNSNLHVAQLHRHLKRLRRSAQILGFAFDPVEAENMVTTQRLAPNTRWRMRLSLGKSGKMELQCAPLMPLVDEVVNVLISDVRLPNQNPLAAHKTTQRQAYDEGVKAAERVGAFDSLFFTEDGRLVEGLWFTPPVVDGALPGVMRACLLEDAAWAATERSLNRDDLVHNVQAVVVCNALRGVLRAQLLHIAN
jgi:para-aminobenzoate synthetase / 4-amino-4-deoxychorismate lyase